MRVFELYRYMKPSPGPDVEFIDSVRNLFNATRWPAWPGLSGAGRVQLDRGIDSVKKVRAIDGVRRPASLIALVKEAALRGVTVADSVASVDTEYDAGLSSRQPAEILRD